MSLEVVTRFRRSNEDCIQQLVDLHVPDFGLVKDLADVVHRMLTVWTLPGGGPVRLFPLDRTQGAPELLHPVSFLKSGPPRSPGHGGLQRPLETGTRLSRQLSVPP
jgi:hypothetical protein